MALQTSRLIIVMGVSGCGKSTTGAALATRLDCPFLDGDDYHPPANKEKMRNGTPLVDDDRWPWLETLIAEMKANIGDSGYVVAACSALKRSYRDFITEQAGEPVAFLHLAGSKQLILDRMNARQHEYMPTALLDSQFETLEVPQEDENVVALDITPPTDQVAEEALGLIQAASHPDS